MMRAARIDLQALRHNFRTLRHRVAPAGIMGVVKADAYGHGVGLVAPALEEEGLALFGVADIDEAVALRATGVRAPIVAWLHGTDADFPGALAAGVEVVVSSLSQLRRAATAGSAVVHLKIDTGLSRNGASAEDWPALVARAAEFQAAGRIRVRGIMSHLSNTSPEDDAKQLARFVEAIAAALKVGIDPEFRHIAASQAAISTPGARSDLVRLGIALYGLSPDPLIDVRALGLQPVMTLESEVVAVRNVPARAGVSYGYTHRFEEATRVALVPLGYADGVPRAVSNRGAEVAIGGSRYPIVGTIAMDQFVVDVGDAQVKVGDRVVVWGDPARGEPSADEWAAWAGTINYEIVTRVGARVPRVPA